MSDEDEIGRVMPGAADAILADLRRQMAAAGGTPRDMINLVVAAAAAEFATMDGAVQELEQLRNTVDTWLTYARELAKPKGFN